MPFKRGWLALGLAWLWLLAGGVAWAQTGQQMEIILDASGSMWGQAGGEAKIAAAKRVLVELVESLSGRQDLQLAIRVYGHQSPREKKDCQDSKLELPFGPVDPAKARELVQRVTARGYTPIAYSLLQAKDDFGPAESKRSLVLITDGLESCDGDPCRVARELAAKGIDVTLHVVGFGLSEADLGKLRCLVEPSGGLLLGAQDARQLQDALGQVVRRSLAENLVVKVVDGRGNPVRAQVEVLAGDGKLMGRGGGDRVGFKLPAGIYKAQAQGPNQNKAAQDGVTLTEDALTEVVLTLKQSGLVVKAADPSGQPVTFRAFVETRQDGGDFKALAAQNDTDGQVAFQLPPGDYRVRVKDAKTGAGEVGQEFSLAEGESKEVWFTLGRGRVIVKAKDQAGRPVRFRAFVEARGENGEFGPHAARNDENGQADFDLTPGEYQVRVKDAKTGAQVVLPPFDLANGQTQELLASFAQGQVVIKANDEKTGKPVRFRAFLEARQDTGDFKPVKANNDENEQVVFDLPPGEYQIKVRDAKTGAEVLLPPFNLAGGQTENLSASFAQGKVVIKANDEKTGKPVRFRAFLEARQDTGDFKPVKADNDENGQVVFDLPPGEYQIKVKDAKTGAQVALPPFNLAGGQTENLSASFAQGKVVIKANDEKTGKPVRFRAFLEARQDTGDFKPVKADNDENGQVVFDLPPGEYQIKVKDAKTGAQVALPPFNLAGGQTQELMASFAQGKVVIKANDEKTGKPVRFRAFLEARQDTGDFKPVKADNDENGQVVFDLPPGEYQIKVKDAKTGAQVALPPFNLAGGQTQDLLATFAQARVVVTLRDASGQPVLFRAFLEARQDTGDFKSMKATNDEHGQVVFDLPPGDYRIKVKSRDKEVQGEVQGEPFTLQGGDQRAEALTLP